MKQENTNKGRKMEFIAEAQEHDFQFCSKSRAIKAARMQTARTKMTHTVVLTQTYRDLNPLKCWTTKLSLSFNANGGTI